MPITVGPHIKTWSKLVKVNEKQLTAGQSSAANKYYPGNKCRVVGIRFQPGVIGAGTAATGIVGRVKKTGTLLHAVDVVLQSSSTLNATDALLSPTLVATPRTTTAVGLDDYITVEVELTGGSTITLDGIGAEVTFARE